VQLVDVVTATEDKLTLAIDNASHLPAWLSWMERNENLGDVTLRTAYTGYLPFKGVRLPMGYNTTMDFRNVTASKIYVDKYAVDDVIDDLAAPPDVRSAPAPAPLLHPCHKSHPLPRACGCFIQPAEAAERTRFCSNSPTT
jgi:hypothetical protein